MADKKISQLTSSGAIGGTEELPIVQGGSTVKTTINAIKTFFLSSLGLSDVLNISNFTNGKNIKLNDGSKIAVDNYADYEVIYISEDGIEVYNSTIDPTPLFQVDRINDIAKYKGVELNSSTALISQTITSGVTDKAPSEDVVFDALALKRSTTTEMLLFSGGFAATNLVASLTYYFSNMSGLSTTATQNFSKFTFANNFIVTKVVLTCSHNINPTSGNTALYIRESATTDKTITTTLDLNTVGANTSKVFIYSGLSISVTSGLNYELKLVTPVMATLPTNARWHIQLWGY